MSSPVWHSGGPRVLDRMERDMAYLSDAKVNGSIVPTRDYTTGWWKERTLKAGTTVIVTRIHKGCFGGVTHLTVRNPKTGEFFKEVPWEYFRAD